MFKVYTKDEATVIENENDSIMDKGLAVVTAPFRFSDDKLVTQKSQAITVLVWSAVAGLAGELVGHHRAAKGQQALIPFGRP